MARMLITCYVRDPSKIGTEQGVESRSERLLSVAGAWEAAKVNLIIEALSKPEIELTKGFLKILYV
jgi:hypothetical protein